MSRTIDRVGKLGRAAAIAMAIVATVPTAAQTIGDLANAQRLKQQTEIAKLQREAAAAELELAAPLKQAEPVKPSEAETRAAARKAAEASRPKIVLHSLYARNGVWVAELAQGQRLELALVGMQIYGNRVIAITQDGILLSKPCGASDVREKVRCGNRLLPVGEAV